MKKSLICLAVLGLSAAAQAQSALTLAGTVDNALNRVTGSLSSKSQVVSGANSTSKLIMRGTEDLGGGMAGFFHLEMGLNTDTGVGTASSSNNQPSGVGAEVAGRQGLLFNRRSIVGLVGPWGEVHAGREWAPSYDAFTSRYDLFGVGSGIGLNYTSSANPTLVRLSNDVGYTTPQVLGGLSLNVQHWFGENASNAAGGTASDGTGSGFRFNYDNGPISAVLHYSRTNFAAGDTLLRGVAAYYDPGAWKVAFNLNRDEAAGVSQRGFNVGGLIRVGVGEIKATYAGLRFGTPGAPEGRKLSLGYVYNLSKRTALYTTVARITNKNGAALAIAGATTAPNQSSTGFDLGIRHNF